MTALPKSIFRSVAMAALGLSLAGCVDLAGGLFLTVASLRSLQVSVADEAGRPVPHAQVSLYRKVRDRVHGGYHEVLAVGPLVTDEKGFVLATLPRCSPVVVRAALPDGRQARSEQPWPKVVAELHLVIEGPSEAPDHAPEAAPSPRPPMPPNAPPGAPPR